MATYADVVKFEDEAPANTIRLIKSGEFYRAYNHSAWLFHCCIARHRVMRKFVKSIQCEIFYIGFPEKSLLNNIGERKSIKTEYGFDVELAADEIPEEENYDTWKLSIETEHSSKGDFFSLPLAGVDAEKEVVRLLREFPIENKTMVECTVFVAELRKLLNNR